MEMKHSCVVDAEGFYQDIVLQWYKQIYAPPPEKEDGPAMAEPRMEWTPEGRALAEGERLIDAAFPSIRPHAGASGFVRPRWDDETSGWVEGATVEETAAWEAEHPAPETPPMSETTMTQLAVAELAQVIEDQNTANQLAVAELAEALMGGEGA